MTVEAQILETLRALNMTMGTLAHASGYRAGGNSRSDEFDRRPGGGPSAAHAGTSEKQIRQDAKKFHDSIETYDKAMKKFLKGSSLFGDERQELLKNMSKASSSLSDFTEDMDFYRQGIGKLSAQAERVVGGMGRFYDTLAKSTKAQSLFYAEQLRNTAAFKDFEFAAYTNKLTEAANRLDEGTKKALGIIDEATGKLRTDLQPRDFKRVLEAIGEVDALTKEILSKGNLSLDDIIKNGLLSNDAVGGGVQITYDSRTMSQIDAAKEIVTKLVEVAQANGLADKIGIYKTDPHDKDKFLLDEQGNKILHDLDVVAAKLATVTGKMGEASGEMKKTVVDFTNGWRRFFQSVADGEGKKMFKRSLDDWIMGLSAGALAMKAWRKTLQGVAETYRKGYDFNVAQVNQGFIGTVLDSIKSGQSFEDTTKFLQENKRSRANVGGKSFDKMVDSQRGIFNSFGYTSKQAAELFAPMTDLATVTGVNTRNLGEMTDFTNKVMTSFQNLAGVIDISAKEYIELNTALLKSDGAFETLAGMDKQRRAAYAADLIQLRDRYVLGGLEKDQAQQLVQLQQQQSRDAVKSKLGAGGKLMNAALFAGMSPDQAMRMMTLRNKGRLTSDEQAEMAQLQGNLGQMIEQRRNSEADSNNGFTWFSDAFRDSNAMESSDSQVQKFGMTANMANEAGRATSGGEAKRAAADAKGSSAFATIATAVDRVTNLLSNSFTSALISGAGAALLMAYQMQRLSAILGTIAGTGALSGAAGAAGAGGGAAGTLGKFGKYGKYLGMAGKGLGYAGMAVGAGLTVKGIYDSQQDYNSGQITQQDRNTAVGSGVGNLAGNIGGGIAGQMAGKAAGMMLGRMLGGVGGGFLGPVGSIAGMMLGSYLGGMAGEWAGGKIGGMFGSPATKDGNNIVPAEGINTTASEGGVNQNTLSVADKATVEQLISLNATMAKAVDFLEKMAVAQGVPTKTDMNVAALPNLPTQQTFVNLRTSS